MRNGEILRKEYVCSKEGTTSIREITERKSRRGMTREGCNVKLTAVKSKSGGYVVKQFVEGHTHTLTTPRRVHHLRSHHNVSIAKKSLSQQLSVVDIPTCQQIRLLEVQAGGIQNIGFTERDIYNYERKLKNEMKGHDAELLYEHFFFQSKKRMHASITPLKRIKKIELPIVFGRMQNLDGHTIVLVMWLFLIQSTTLTDTR
ncbi:hypothetical protein Ddye_025132 [Dipteronia dyeriana]|uniref:FAR1 domain-containing protein n=1 Tax=Dipteronia dyeriana TaxID=168575 RepID=A0AAD9TX56_9ROSI|nr:hypothetical protein Ddye_025132 [Dipteronia dyeriana]